MIVKDNSLTEIVENKSTLDETIYSNVTLNEVRRTNTNLSEYGSKETAQSTPQILID